MQSSSERIQMRIEGRTRPLSMGERREPLVSSASSTWQGLPFEVHRMRSMRARDAIETGPLPSDYGLLVVLEGEIEISSRDEGRLVRETGREGSITMLAGNALRRFEELRGHAQTAAINIAPAWLERAELTDRLQRLRFVQDDTVLGMARAIRDEVARGVPGGPLFAEALSVGLLEHVADRYGAAGHSRPKLRGQLSSGQKARLIEHVRANLASELSLATLSSEIGVSPRHFLTLFRRAFGTSPHRYVLEQRVSASEQLIAQGERDLAAVALAVGFSSQSHLTTAFRSARGLTPARFARALR